MKHIKLLEMLESYASDKAKQMGLDYMSFGRWGKNGQVTHQTQGDKLVAVSVKGGSATGHGDTPKPDYKDVISTQSMKTAEKPKLPPHLNKLAPTIEKLTGKLGSVDKVQKWIEKKSNELKSDPEYTRGKYAPRGRASARYWEIAKSLENLESLNSAAELLKK